MLLLAVPQVTPFICRIIVSYALSDEIVTDVPDIEPVAICERVKAALAAAAHFNPRLSVESAVRTCPFVPIGTLASTVLNP
jgi:hypothetical protein